MSHKDVAPTRDPFLHMPVPWVFVLAYFIGVGVQILVPVKARSGLQIPAQIGGAVLFVLGAAIAGWSLGLFRRGGRTTTTPGDFSTRLVTNGPFRFTRNPMYLGLVLAYLGEEGLVAQIWPLPFLALTVVYVNWFVLPIEEASLEEVFGERYRRYCAGVRRWI
jgi:protein-S-isoprenylcysteine O-methyltransferase Ste14